MFRLVDRLVEGIAVFAFAVSSIFICINVINRYLVLGAMPELSRTYDSFAPVYLFFREWLGAISVTADEVPGFHHPGPGEYRFKQHRTRQGQKKDTTQASDKGQQGVA